ncbi:MAG: metallophosphoesterase [Candidatus Omnitrophota bacterium]|nr:MAG: metallophosphoesterase [Candidatus Omnitrophota bacterium]
MRYGIFSDVHSNLEAFGSVIGAYRQESIDEYLCIGDVVGYGANPNECIEKTRKLCRLTIAGNHDQASAGLFSVDEFNSYAKAAAIWTSRVLDKQGRNFVLNLQLVFSNNDLTLVHGSLREPEKFHYLINEYEAIAAFRLLENNICFVGHSHVPGIFIQEEGGRIEYIGESRLKLKNKCKYIINVGSVGQPRDNNWLASYCIYDSQKMTVEIKRTEYDVEKARDKIIKAGLPPFLGERLLSGR